ncbi:MAG: hypothetical protein ACFFFO_17670 [Candidatus Thorarchaeota archaeon]
MTKGQRARIRNFTLSGREFLEGIATLRELVQRGPSSVSERWLVHFDGDCPEEVYPREVLDEDVLGLVPKRPTKRINLLDPR